MKISCIGPIDATTYQQHSLHRSEKSWPETNCYIDVWIEIIHALNLDPTAMLPMVFAIDFEGDQWTFYKPPHEDLHQLYGIDIQELNVWNSLLDHCIGQIQRRRLVLIETDAYFLPDTAGTDYRTKHTKTTIGIQSIDLVGKVMGYFHNASYYELRDEDFVKTFRLDQPNDSNHMPFLAEFARIDRLSGLTSKELAACSRQLLCKHYARRPLANPLVAFATRYESDVQWLKAAGLATFHSYAFATLRQIGSAFELGGYYLRWLGAQGQLNCGNMPEQCEALSQAAKSLMLKSARAVNTGKSSDFSGLLGDMAASWDAIMCTLGHELNA
ncbi:MAG: DUF1839 family protein [Deltaproteobacteria bacterium]|nr:DUF1839 family protein [Deltaproteobacteria bacterium]